MYMQNLINSLTRGSTRRVDDLSISSRFLEPSLLKNRFKLIKNHAQTLFYNKSGFKKKKNKN